MLKDKNRVCSKDYTADLNAQYTARGEGVKQTANVCVRARARACACARACVRNDPRPLPFTVTARSEVREYTVLDRLHSWIMCSVPALGVIMSNEIFKVQIMSKGLSRVSGRRVITTMTFNTWKQRARFSARLTS
jgi:hypothetical protein